MSFTEFYTDFTNGNQMNGGSPIGGSYPISYTGGDWVSGTGVFTPISGNPSSAGVTVGDFAAVFADGATTPSFVGRVTVVTTTTITVSTTVAIGSVPTSSAGAHNRSIRVGGAWKGPNAADAWPVGSVTNVLVNSSSNPPRVNMKNTATYAITTGVTQNQPGVTYQGYSSTVGDFGRATVDGSTNAIVLWTHSGGTSTLADLIFSNNGTTGANAGISVSSGGASSILRCVVHDVRGAGISMAIKTLVDECELYLCNGSNTANTGGVTSSDGMTCVNTVSHDNAGSNSSGFVNTGSSSLGAMVLIGCISDTNGAHGVKATSTGPVIVSNCDFYNNGGSGVDLATANASTGFIQNSNFVKNTGNGVTGAASGTSSTVVLNCGFGTGTQANAATTSGRTVQELSSITYASGTTPWTNPGAGDFHIALAIAIAAGRGSFTQTQAAYGTSTSQPVIGSCQVADYPAESAVTSGVHFGNSSYTGTLSAAGVVSSRIVLGM